MNTLVSSSKPFFFFHYFISVIVVWTLILGIFLSMNAFKLGSMNFFGSTYFLDGDSFSLSGACRQFLSVNFGGLLFVAIN